MICTNLYGYEFIWGVFQIVHLKYLTWFSVAQSLHISSSSARPRATIRFLWTVVRSDLGTLKIYTHGNTPKHVSTLCVRHTVRERLLHVYWKMFFCTDAHTYPHKIEFFIDVNLAGIYEMLFTFGVSKMLTVMFVTHPTAMKRMKVKRRPHRDTPQPMNVSTCRAFSFSALLWHSATQNAYGV